MSKRADILDRLLSVVDGATPAALNCYLRRVTDLASEQLPAVMIVPGNTPVRVAGSGVAEHVMDVSIVVLTKGQTAMADAEEIMQPVLAAVAEQRTLGDLATDLTLTALTEEKEQTDQVRCALAATVSIRFETGLWAF